MKTYFNLTKLVLLLLLGTLTFSLTSCNQTEGYGGTSSVTGTIITSYYNDDFSELIKQGPSIDEEVFLMFGNDELVGDRIFTSLSGQFRFEYLRPGSYTLYYMSDDSTTSSTDEKVVVHQFELKSGEDKDLGELSELKVMDYDDGSAKIYGVIRLINYKNSSVFPFLEPKDTSFAQDHEVYLIYGEHDFYDSRIRTSYDGYFEFTNLIPGKYTVFTYSEDVSGGTADIRLPKNDEGVVIITGETEEINMGVITIEQL